MIEVNGGKLLRTTTTAVSLFKQLVGAGEDRQTVGESGIQLIKSRFSNCHVALRFRIADIESTLITLPTLLSDIV